MACLNYPSFVKRGVRGAEPGPQRRFCRMDEVAEMFSTSANQIRALLKRGDLRAIQIGGRGQWRIEQAGIDAYVERAYEAADATLTAPHGTGEVTEPGDLPEE